MITIPLILEINPSFNIDFFIIIDFRVLSVATLYRLDFIPNMHKSLVGTTISRIAYRLKALGIGFILYKIKDN